MFSSLPVILITIIAATRGPCYGSVCHSHLTDKIPATLTAQACLHTLPTIKQKQEIWVKTFLCKRNVKKMYWQHSCKKNLECQQSFSKFFHVVLNLKDIFKRVKHTDGNAWGLQGKTETWDLLMKTTALINHSPTWKTDYYMKHENLQMVHSLFLYTHKNSSIFAYI